LLDLKKEYALALAKLTLSRHLPELANSYSMISPVDCVSMYVKCGLHEAAADMCGLFELGYNAVFVGVSGDWELVRDFLGRFDGEENGWKYHAVVLESVFRVDADVKIPRWFGDACTIQDLVRVHVKYGRRDEAVRVVLAFLDNQGRVRNKLGAGSRWGPWSLIEGLVGDGQEVKEGVERYIELVEREGILL
jgi:hypothetical protein